MARAGRPGLNRARPSRETPTMTDSRTPPLLAGPSASARLLSLTHSRARPCPLTEFLAGQLARITSAPSPLQPEQPLRFDPIPKRGDGVRTGPRQPQDLIPYGFVSSGAREPRLLQPPTRRPSCRYHQDKPASKDRTSVLLGLQSTKASIAPVRRILMKRDERNGIFNKNPSRPPNIHFFPPRFAANARIAYVGLPNRICPWFF